MFIKIILIILFNLYVITVEAVSIALSQSTKALLRLEANEALPITLYGFVVPSGHTKWDYYCVVEDKSINLIKVRMMGNVLIKSRQRFDFEIPVNTNLTVDFDIHNNSGSPKEVALLCWVNTQLNIQTIDLRNVSNSILSINNGKTIQYTSEMNAFMESTASVYVQVMNLLTKVDVNSIVLLDRKITELNGYIERGQGLLTNLNNGSINKLDISERIRAIEQMKNELQLQLTHLRLQQASWLHYTGQMLLTGKRHIQTVVFYYTILYAIYTYFFAKIK